MTDPLKRSAEVLREYAEMIEDGEMHRSGPLKGRCAPAIEEELAEYRQLAEALVARSESVAFVEAAKRFAAAHVHSDQMDALDNDDEANDAEYEAADREYNASKAALVAAFKTMESK